MYIDEKVGMISYNGIDIKEMDMVDARRNFLSFAEQEPRLVSDTIRYNLTFNNNELENDNIAKYTEILNMHEFLNENTMDYVINETGANTSGGEKQKVSILKALYKDAPLMIFDEPTSALDTKTTKKFFDYLEQVKSDKIIIIVTHDASIMQRCTSVIELG